MQEIAIVKQQAIFNLGPGFADQGCGARQPKAGV